MALRSIGNIIGTRRAAAKSTSSKTSAETSPETKPIKSRVLTLNLHGSTDSSDSEEIDEISRLFEKAPESSKKALKGQPIASSSSSSTSANSSQITRRKRPVKRVIDEDDDNDDDKENRKPQIPAQTQLDQTSLHDDTISIVSTARAPSGSSITITKRVKLAQATLKSDAIFIESKREEKAKKSPAKPRVRTPVTPVKKLTIETPKKEEKDFDYFLSHSMNESMSQKEEKPESESIESSNSRPKRRSAQKAMSKVLLIKANDDLDLQDVDSDDEDKSIKKKYKSRTSKDDEEMKLFESEEQDDEMEYKPKKRKSKSSKAKKPLKTSVVKSPQIKRASNRSRTKSKHHYDALNDDEATEKQLQEAAKEYNEIKNYKLIVE